MRNLKKLLAVITVVAMIATLFVIPASAAGLSDIAGSKYETAATRLNALGIITGRSDGKFYPDDTITRAEFAAVVVRSLGYGTAADAAKGQTKFADVASDFWASGYINLANSLGIIKGRPDGSFGPNDKVLYEEAVTMIVRALGYEPAATANGGYPTGYLTIASQEDIDDDAVSAIGAPASRGIVAQLVDNSLEVAMMIQSGYGTEQTFVKSGTQNTTKQTLLDTKLKLDVYKVEVKSTDTEDKTMKIQIRDISDNPAGDRGELHTYKVFDGINFAGLNNANVTVWVKDDVVYNIKNDTTIVYDYIDKINGHGDKTELDITGAQINDITLKSTGANYDVQEKSDGTADLTYIEDKGNVYDGNISGLTKTQVDNIVDPGNRFAKVFIEDGKITRLETFTTPVGNVGIVTANENGDLTMTKGTAEGKKLLDLDAADSLLVVVDGKAATLSDITNDMVVNYWQSNKNYVIAASSKKIEGKLESAKSDKLKIDGTWYSMFTSPSRFYSTDNGDGYSAYASENDANDMLGSDVVAYVNAKNTVVYFKADVTDTTTSFYGIVITKGSLDDKLKIGKYVDGEYKEVTYATDLRSATSGSNLDFADVNDVTVTSPNRNLFDLDASGGVTAFEQRAAAFYKFTVDSNNVITKVEEKALTRLNDVTFSDDADSITSTGGTRVYMGSDVNLFNVTTSTMNAYKWSSVRSSNITTAGNNVDVYVATGDTTPAYALINDVGGGALFENEDYYFGLVTDKYSANKDDYAITLTTNEGSKTLLVDKDKDLSTASDKFVAYRLVSGEDRAEIVSNATYDVLAATAAKDATDWAEVSNNTVTAASINLDDQTISIGGVAYDLAEDAVILHVNDLGDNNADFSVSDLSDIDDDNSDGTLSHASVFTVKGKVKFLFYWNDSDYTNY